MIDLLRFGVYIVWQLRPARDLLRQFAVDLDKQAHKRMFSLAIYAVAGSYPYVVLRGKSISKEENTSLTCLGAATALCDDLTDQFNYPLSALKTLFAEGVFHDKSNSTEIACYALYKRAMQTHPNPELFLKHLFDALEAQEQSKLQRQTIEYEKIWDITAEKGRLTNRLFLHFLHHRPDANEEAFAMQAGVTLQLLDDLFDLYEDLQDNIRTPVTTAKDLDELEALYIEQAKKTIHLLRAIGGKHIKRAEAAVGFIFARGTIAIDQYRHFCHSTNQAFPPSVYQRKDLIVDMEKGGNLIRNVSRRFVFSPPERGGKFNS